ncbi:MAG: rRNA maturation RNase YbeY [Clostridium sp.]|nr:rRNA maturation RNase YbeY [Clostridium sp.]MDY3829154.1 rRNA maturation RNase YbeY [Clostridium sp.]
MIYVDDRQEVIVITDKEVDVLRNTILFALKEEEVNIPCEVSLIFVDNASIREINRENRQIDRETDVLSFPMLEYENNMVFKEYYKDFKFDETYLDEGELVIGDIVLSLEKAKEQAKEYGHSFERECNYLVIHSVLHLLGYDHMVEEDKVKMREREEELLNKLGISR